MVLLLILVLGTVLLSLPVVQTRLARYTTNTLNERYGTNIAIDRLQISLATLETKAKGIFVEDHKGDTLFHVANLSTSLLNLGDLTRGELEFGDMELEKAFFNMKTYQDESKTNLDVFVSKLATKSKPGAPPFKMVSDRITITDGHYRLWDENSTKRAALDLTEIDIEVANFSVFGIDVNLDVETLSLNSSNGLRLEELQTQFRYSKEAMRIDSIQLRTAESNLVGNLVFEKGTRGFANFSDSVRVKGSFNESKIALNEINQFYKEFGADKEVVFSGNIDGVLNHLRIEELRLIQNGTIVRGNFGLKNLLTKEAPFILDAEIDKITSTYYELRALLPNLLGKNIPPAVQKLGTFTARGNAEITETSIDAEINLSSPLGQVYTDLQMINVQRLDKASYLGLISLIDFDLGGFVDNKSLGKATLDVNVEGNGLLTEYLNTEVIGDIYKLQFNGYEYQNAKVSGILKSQLFDGFLVSEDSNFKFNFKGLADFAQERNNFNFSASVAYADLKKLNFIKDSTSVFKGDIKMDITGTNLDDIVGNLRFENTVYQNKNDTYVFDDFAIESSFDKDTIRSVTINSPDIITGYARGKFKVNELGKLIQNSVGSIYTNYRPFEITEGQELSFNFKIYNKIVDVFFPEVAFDANTFIRGKILSDENDFKLTFKSPSISAYGNELDSLELKIDNKNPFFNTFISVADMSTIYYDVKNFELINTTLKDTLFFRTEFKGGSEFDDRYNLNFYHTFNENNKSVIGLKKSEVIFKGNTWVLNKGGDRKNKVILNSSLDSITIQDVVMDHGDSEQIRLQGKLADSTYKDLKLEFKIVSLDKITPAIEGLKMEGKVDGSLNILQKDKKYLPTSSLNIKDFEINDSPVGDVEIGIFGNNNLTEFGVNTWINNNGREKMSLNGKVTSKNQKTELDLNASFTDFDLSPFKEIGGGIISNIRGSMNGNVRLSGNVNNPSFNGLVTLDKAGIAVPYLNVDYSFAPSSRVRLTDQSFNFERIRLTDVDEQTKATVDGIISHNQFKEWFLDLDIDTNDDRFLVLNTDFTEDALYYGQGFINGTGRIEGPSDALNIKVNALAARGTSLKIPLRDITSVGDYSFIEFIESNEIKALDQQRELETYRGIEMEFEIEATPEAEIEVVLDQKTGSSLKGTGGGLLLMQINTNGKFDMIGEFVTVSGEFNYRFGGVIDKTFSVRPGGRIIWDGDPLSAQLGLEAVYSLNANPAPLLDGSGFRGRIPTEVLVRLDGELEQPNISFDIAFPGTNSVIQSELEYRLQDPTIEERNAFFLLAQGTFVNEQPAINEQAVTGNLIQTASGLFNQILAGDNDKFNFGLSYEQGYQDINELEIEDRIGVTVSTKISDRILVNGRVGVPIGGVSGTVVAGDVEVQILLNDEGTLSAKVFNRESEIQQFLTENQGYTQGVGLSYQVDFNDFRSLMQKVFSPNRKRDIIPVVEVIEVDSLRQIVPKQPQLKRLSTGENK